MTKRKAKAAAALDEPEEKFSDEQVKSHSSWKFDFLKVVNADPLTIPSDLAIIAAYLEWTSPHNRIVYLSALSLRVSTSIVSPETIVTRRRHLVGLGYLIPRGKTKMGVERFELINARETIVFDHITEASSKLREMDADRKRRDRERRQAKAHVPPIIEGTEKGDVPPIIEDAQAACPTNNRRDVPPIIEDNSPVRNTCIPDSTEEEDISEEGSPSVQASPSTDVTFEVPRTPDEGRDVLFREGLWPETRRGWSMYEAPPLSVCPACASAAISSARISIFALSIISNASRSALARFCALFAQKSRSFAGSIGIGRGRQQRPHHAAFA